MRIRQNSIKSKDGFILIHLIIGIFFVGTSLLFFSSFLHHEQKRVQALKENFEKDLLHRSKIYEAIALLAEDDAQKDDLTESWHQETGSDDPSQPIYFEIEDECSKLDLNQLLHSDKKFREKYESFIQKLFKVLQISSIDSKTILNKVKNEGPLVSLKQIPTIQKIKKERGLDLEKFLTVYSGGRININTAPKEILEVLLAEASPFLIKEILYKRKKSGFTNEKEELTGVPVDLTDFLATRSFFFQIKSFEKHYPKIRVILNRELGEVKIRQWLEEERP